MEVNTNIKGLKGSYTIGRRTAIMGKNEQGKSALGIACLLPLTKIANFELMRSQLSGRTLAGARPANAEDNTMFAELTSGGEVKARWSLKGQGNPKLEGPAAGSLVNVWAEVESMLTGSAPKMAIAILKALDPTHPEVEVALAAYVAVKREIAAAKKKHPGATPVIPADPREAMLRAKHAVETAVTRGGTTDAAWADLFKATAMGTRYKDGLIQLEALRAYKRTMADLNARLDSAKVTILALANQRKQSVESTCGQHMRLNESVTLDFEANTAAIVRAGVTHGAPSGSGFARLVLALGSALYGDSGALLIPDVQWDTASRASFMQLADESPLRLICMTLAPYRGKLPNGWVTVKL